MILTRGAFMGLLSWLSNSSRVKKAMYSEERRHFHKLESAFDSMMHAQKDYGDFLKSARRIFVKDAGLSDHKKEELHRIAHAHVSAVHLLQMAVFDLNYDAQVEQGLIDKVFVEATGVFPGQVAFILKNDLDKRLLSHDRDRILREISKVEIEVRDRLSSASGSGQFRHVSKEDIGRDPKLQRLYEEDLLFEGMMNETDEFLVREKRDLSAVRSAFVSMKNAQDDFFGSGFYGRLLSDKEKSRLYDISIAHSKAVCEISAKTIDLCIWADACQRMMDSLHVKLFGKNAVKEARLRAKQLDDDLEMLDKARFEKQVIVKVEELSAQEQRGVTAVRRVA